MIEIRKPIGVPMINPLRGNSVVYQDIYYVLQLHVRLGVESSGPFWGTNGESG